MSESLANEVPGTVAKIGLEAAYAANEAFDRVRELEGRIATYAIAQSTEGFDPGVYAGFHAELEIAEEDFSTLSSMAAPAMTAPNSPFAVGIRMQRDMSREQADSTPAPQRTFEHIIDHTSPLGSLTELQEFAKQRGYSDNVARPTFTAVRNAALFDSGDHAQLVQVDEFDDYVAPALADMTDTQLVRVITLTADNRAEYGTGIDKASLYLGVKRWLKQNPRISGLGVRGIQLLADYCNHAIPNLEEPLPVPDPPAKKAGLEIAHLTPDELIFDRVGEQRVVSNRSLIRYAYSIGYTPSDAPPFTSIFTSFHDYAAPETKSVYDEPQEVAPGFFYLGTNLPSYRRVSDWGMTPERFKELIVELEKNPNRKQEITGYSERSQRVVFRYLAAMTKHLESDAA